MKSNLSVLGDNILIKVISDDKEKMDGGIWLPQTTSVFTDTTPDMAIVLKLGTKGGRIDPDKKFIPFSVKEGDYIIVEKMMGTTLDEKDYPKMKLIKEEHILAILS